MQHYEAIIIGTYISRVLIARDIKEARKMAKEYYADAIKNSGVKIRVQQVAGWYYELKQYIN